MTRHFPTRFLAAVAVSLGLLVAPESVRAQIAGESVNMVTGTDPIGGDPYLQRQNEPSIAVSSANPEHLLAGANDYRTVDIAKAPADKMAGDAWAGIFKSLDGGKSWKSYLMPGYPQDPARYDAAGAQLPRTSPQAPTLMWCGNATAAVPEVRDASGAVVTEAVPATDGTCTSAADPVVRSGADGMIYFGGIVFQRYTSNGKVYLARFIDLNNKENGDATQGSDPIRFVDQKVVALGGPTDFVDKPWVAVDVPRASNPACSVNVNTRNPVTGAVTTTNRTFPGHTIYVAYLRLYDGETRSDVMVRHSDDCGATWAAPVKVSDATSLANEGPSLAIDPVKGHVYVTWRRVQITDAAGAILQTNSIMLSRSFSRATKFTKPREVAPVALPFDQNKDIVKAAYSAADPQGTWKHSVFRVTLFPSAAISVDKAGARRLHVAWSERGGGAVSTDARVVVATKVLSPPPITEREEDETDGTCQKLDRPRPADGKPILVDSKALDAQVGLQFERGHQFMPSLTFSQGRLMLVYYDSRLDHSRSLLRPKAASAADPSQPDATGAFYDVIRAPIAASNTKGADQFTDTIQNVFIPFIDDGLVAYVRHTLDVRVAQADPADAPSFKATALSKFPFGTRGDEAFLMDGNGDLLVPAFPNGVDPEPSGTVAIVKGKKPQLLQQLKVNPPNLPMFKGGTTPFLGDYIDVQGPAFVKKSGKWVFNNDWVASPVFHAVWTSNEDVRAPLDDNWGKYTPVFVPPGSNGYSKQDPTQRLDACVAGTPAVQYTGTRNQNIYTSRITDGLVVTTPQNAKPLDATQIRSFVVAAANTTSKLKTVKFTFSGAGVSASFRIKTNGQLDALTTVTAEVAPHSSVSRTLFAKSTNPSATITVTVTEQGGAAATGFVLLNPPGSIPGLVAPDGAGSITGAAGESYKAIEIAANLSNANLSNANLSNANLEFANLSNANLSNANLSNANLSNANLSNAALANLSNANLSNANLSNANLSNANLSNANLSNANLSNANLSNANLSNAAVSDLNYEYQNNGNTTSSYTIKLVGTQPNALAGEKIHLIVAKTYTTPTAVGCSLKEEAHNHILASIPDVGAYVVDPATKVDPSVSATAAQYATLVLAPGEKAQITLRGNVPLARMAEIGSKLAPRPVPQQTPIGGTNGTTTYAQYTPRAATTTALSHDGSAVFTATVKDAALAAVTSGSVNFVAAGNVFLGTVALSATGTATLTPTGLPSGTTVAAYYSGANAYLPSQASLTTTAINVIVNPASVTLAPGDEQIFTATVTGTPDPTVIWSVDETGAGTISNAGLYIAHAVPGTYHVRATSSVDSTKTATATVIVSTTPPPPPPVTVTLSPSAPVLVAGQLQTFTATVAGTTNLAVTWTVAPSTGVIFTELSNSTASFETTVPGSYTVTATTVALPAASASTTFTVGANVPSAPTLLRVTGVGNGQVSLAWSPPASDGGSPIAGYKVTHTWGTGNAFTTTINGSSTTAIVGGLTNGIPYSFTVAAFNAAGAGMSPESNSVTATPAVPATVPAAPLGYTAMVGNGVATLGWPAPSSDGGSPITGYTVTVSPAPGSVVVTGRTAAVSGLTNGVAYTFTVAAINAVGQGPASVPFGPFTPAGVPGAPPGLIVTPGNASAALSWTAPPSNGSAIIEYSVSVSPATGFYTISGTSASVIDLANGVAYTFSVAATNGAGTGPASYGTATPAGIPGAPTGLTATAGDRAATLGWTPPATNGSAITGYVVSVTPSAGAVVSVNPATATASVTGLTNDQSYTFTVSAANGVGTGPVSPPSAAFTPKAPVTVGTFNVSGAINSDGYVVIRVMKDGASFSGANVTLTSGSTGVLIPNIGGMTYSTNSYVMPASGQQLTLTVTDGVNTASGSVAVPSRPTITAPTPGLVVPAASPLTVTWTVAPNINPGRFEIQGCWPTPCGGNSWATPGATVRSHTLAANFFPIGSAVSMVLYAVNDLPVTGAATAGSNVWVNARAPNPGYLNFQAAGAPGAPTALTAAPGDGNAYLSWTAPASDGGSAIAGYVVNITPATGNPTSITVSGTTTTVVNLTNGIAYTFTVAAFNGAGSMGPASTPPVTVTPSAPFLAPAQAVSTVAAGENSTFFLAPGGAAKALGQNIDGQLGTGSVAGAWVPNPIPVAMPGGVAVRSIDGGRWHGMAIDSNGGLWGWGNGTATAIGAATMAPVSIVLGAYPASVTATAISAGSRDNGLVLMSNGHVWGIGDDSSGQFGPAPFTGDTRLVSDAGGTVAVAAGATHSMLLASDGTVWTLGMNEWGQLGDGTSSGFGSTFKRTVPQRVIGLDQVVAIAAGEYHSVALRVDGTVWTWGFGDNSQLGNGGVISSPTPVQVRGVNGVGFLTNVDAITTGSGHTLALLGDGTLRAWGFNRNGQLGDGSRLDRATPVAVIGLASITDIAGGASHSVARRSDGTIWAWGLNQSGQLGTGAPSGTAASYSPVPVQVGAVTVTVTPGTASVVGGGTQAFTAVVAGAVNQAVTWRVQETGGGTISAAGLYTAPSTPGTYTVEAQSGADPSKIGTAIVTVTAIPPVATRTRLNLLDVRSDVPVVGLTTFNFRASVLPAAASSPVTGTVTFTVGGVAQAPVVTTGGSAVFTVVSEVMPSITASYNGDTGHFPSTSFPFATGARRVPDSVDAVCSDGTQTIACPTTPGSVGFGQDGTFSTNPPTFAVSATGLSIADSVTGLVWTPLDTSGTAREYPQAQAYCEGMAASAYDSITDWRLPTAREALTIVNTGRNGAAVGPSSFFLYVGTTQNAGIWTSDGYQADPASNWILGLNYPVPRPVPRTGWSPWPGTACVSSGSSAGGSIPTTGGSFLVNLPGSPDIRRDLATGLYWQAGTAVGPGGATTFTWLEAINYCNSLNTPPALGGLTSWRLPNLKELWTLVDITGTSPAIDTSVFPDTVSGAYWSSSPMSIPPTMAYLVDFSDGTGWTPSLFGTTSRLSVRCAAGGVLQVFGY